ncbi:MAG: proton-conducting transporter membrane subunit [Desulfurococcaceae archaeon]
MEFAVNLLGLLTPILALSAFIVPMTKLFKVPRCSFVVAVIASVFAAISSTAVFYHVQKMGPLLYLYGGWPPHFGIVYEIDAFNALIGLLISWVLLAVVVYSYWYGHHIDDPTWYYTLLLGLETGLLGCTYTGDAFNLFVMIEVLSISAYGLVAYHRDRAEAVEAAAKYALIGAVATVLYFTAVIITYAGYGTVNMALLSIYTRSPNLPPAFKYISVLTISFALWVFTYKSALFPNHFWLPDAHPEAPTPVSATLSGLVVNIGIYATVRFLYTIFGTDSVAGGFREITLVFLSILGAASGIVGALMMMTQRDIKRLLAYSTICHVGIIYLGISVGFLAGAREAIELAMTGATIHIIAHGVAKALLFMASGILIDAADSRDLDNMRGIGRYYPITSLALVLGFLNLAGFLPSLGFYSKLLITLGYLNGGYLIGAILVIAISALSIPGYMKVISAVVFATGSEPKRPVKGGWIEIMLLAMAVSLLVLGVLFQHMWTSYNSAALSAISTEGIRRYIMAALDKIPQELFVWLLG